MKNSILSPEERLLAHIFSVNRLDVRILDRLCYYAWVVGEHIEPVNRLGDRLEDVKNRRIESLYVKGKLGKSK